MKKLVPALAIGGFVYSRGQCSSDRFCCDPWSWSMAKNYISNFKLELTKTILDAVPVPEVPKLPKATGPAIPYQVTILVLAVGSSS